MLPTIVVGASKSYEATKVFDTTQKQKIRIMAKDKTIN